MSQLVCPLRACICKSGLRKKKEMLFRIGMCMLIMEGIPHQVSANCHIKAVPHGLLFMCRVSNTSKAQQNP